MWQKIKNTYHLFIATFANIWFFFPSRRLTVVGVSGTDGKTTTVSLIYHILKSSGVKASMISSVGAVISGKDYPLPFHVTTPSPFALQKFINMAAGKNNWRNNKKYLILEVTSHALDQFRVFGTSFDIGIITNVSNEHLDYHKNYKNYVNTKLKLLVMSKNAVINKDDRSYKIINPELKKIEGRISRIITYGLTKSSDVNPESFKFESKLLGEFNKYNILAGITAARLLGIKDREIRKAAQSFEAPIGRQDTVFKKDFEIMIDFAHTPNSFREILKVLRPLVRGKIIHVFGSAGLRDRSKRGEMGKISESLSDILIITAEDPRTESVEDITNDILSGVNNVDFKKREGGILRIPDRQEAINTAVGMAGGNDLVLITGKAHEKSMNYGKEEVPWDEYKAVRKALDLRNEKN